MKRLVLVRTVGPRNAGMIVRIVANFGPAEIVFVAPARPSLLIHPEFEQMSHGAQGLRASVRVVPDLAEALADCTHSVGFTARPRDGRRREDWRELRPRVQEAADLPEQRLALVFGSEENGLTGEETDRCQRLCYLPTAEEHLSLNLAVATALVLSSLYSGRGLHVRETGQHLATHSALAYLRAHLKEVLGGMVAQSEAARQDIEQSIDRVFSRAPIESRDARAWHMMMRALGSSRTPGDFGIGAQPADVRRQAAQERARESQRAKDPEGPAAT